MQAALLVTIKAAGPIPSRRLHVKLAVAGDIDAELLGWLREAYEIC